MSSKKTVGITALVTYAVVITGAWLLSPAPVPVVPQTSVVEVTPQSCVNAIVGLTNLYLAENDILTTIIDEGMDAVTQDQVDEYLSYDQDAIVEAATACLDGTGVGV